MRRAILICNPVAGRYPAVSLAERAAEVLRECDWEIHLEQAQAAEHITQLARQAAQEGLEAVFVVGGDGSINLAVAGLLGSQTALGVLPAGTANVWAQELGLPALSWVNWGALEESARCLATARPHPVDVGVCNGRPFLLWAGVGLDAYIVHQLEPRSRLEKHLAVVQYAASAVWNASQFRGMPLRVQADGEEVSGHFLLGVTSNIHLYAGGFAELSPDARLDDGLLELWLFKGETFADTVQCAWDVLMGTHLDSDRALCIPFRSAVLESDAALYVQVDGEPATEIHRVAIQALPLALKVLVPQETPLPLFV